MFPASSTAGERPSYCGLTSATAHRSPEGAPMSDSAATHELRPTSSRWTHIAVRVSDIDATIAWYLRYTALELLDKREDADGFGAWLGHPDSGDHPFGTGNQRGFGTLGDGPAHRRCSSRHHRRQRRSPTQSCTRHDGLSSSLGLHLGPRLRTRCPRIVH
jgi:hypothetical protein